MSALERIAARAEALARAVSQAAMRNARATLVVAAAITLLPLPGLLRLRSDVDAAALVPRDDPAVKVDRELRAKFDLRDQLIIHFDSGRRGGIFDPRLLHAVRELTADLRAIPEIGFPHVTSLATETRDRLYPGSSKTFGSFLEHLPQTREELAELARDLDLPSARIHTGVIVTADRRGTAILAGVAEDADRSAVYREVAALVEPYRKQGLAIDVAGAPAASALLASHIVRDLALFVPLSLLVAAIVIFAGTRRAAPAAIVLVKSGLCIVWTFAMMGLLGIPLYLTVTIVPLVLVAACLGDEIHLALRFHRAIAEHRGDRVAAARATMHDLALPVVAATLTTCIGFLSCLAVTIEPVRALGAACAIGVAWSLAFSLCVTPALFVLLPAPRAAAIRPAAAAKFASLGVAGRPALAVAAAITVLALAGAGRLTIQDSWIECFAPGSEFRLATDRVNRALHGVHLLHAVIPAPMNEPRAIVRVAALEESLRGRDTVGGVVGAASQLAAVGEFWRLRDAASSERDVARLYDRFDFSPGLVRRRRAVDDARGEAVVTAFLKNANFRATASLIGAIREADGAARFAGDIAVSQAMIPAVVRGQLFSVPLALAGVFVIVMLLCGSARLALYAVVPAVVSGIWLLGALGFAGIPLGVATSMFFTISIGLGVDSHSIHLVARFRQLRDAAESVRQTARSIVTNTVAVAGGFGLVAFSAVPPNQRLGLLIAAGLVSGAALTLLVLPALLALDTQTRNRREAHGAASGVYQPTQQEAP